jgi:hypothetical protein
MMPNDDDADTKNDGKQGFGDICADSSNIDEK